MGEAKIGAIGFCPWDDSKNRCREGCKEFDEKGECISKHLGRLIIFSNFETIGSKEGKVYDITKGINRPLLLTANSIILCELDKDINEDCYAYKFGLGFNQINSESNTMFSEGEYTRFPSRPVRREKINFKDLNEKSGFPTIIVD